MPEHDNNDDNSGLRLPWGNANSHALDQMQAEFATSRDQALKVVAFFDDFTKPGNTINFPLFQRYWHTFDQYDFTPEELTLILSRTAAKIDTMDNMTLKKDCLSEVMFRFSEWEKQAVPKIQQFSQFDLAGCMWAYRKLNLNPSDEFLSAFYKHADPEDILRGDPEDVNFVRSIVSLAVVGLKPSKSFMQAWLPKAIKHMPHFSATQVAFSLWAYARLGVQPEAGFLKSWRERFSELIRENPQSFRPRDLANIMGSAGALSAITGRKYYALIAAKANAILDTSLCTQAEKRQAGYARLWFDLETTYDPVIPPPNETLSKLEIRLKKAFRLASLTEDPNTKPIDRLGYKPDIHFNQEGKPIFIEVDGPPHFLYETNEFTGEHQPAGFTGRSLFMSALIKKFAANAVMLRLPYTVVDYILRQDPLGDSDPENARKTALERLLSVAAAAPAGAYHLRLADAAKLADAEQSLPELQALKLAA